MLDDYYTRRSKALMTKPACRYYHNWDHVQACFENARRLKYDIENTALEKAILYHDIVYDKHPDKEFRSMCMWHADTHMNECTDYAFVKEVSELIMSTHGHDISATSDPRMIRVDLTDLTHPSKTIENFSKILKESIAIYDSTEILVAKAGLEFMIGLEQTCKKNKMNDDKEYSQFWDDVINGIKLTQGLYGEIIHYNDRKLARVK